MNSKIWRFKDIDFEVVKNVAKENNLPEVLANILVARGLTDKDEIEFYLNPSKERFYDPFLMKDMDKAVTRIIQAKEKDEAITIYGDYDVDGITSTSILYMFLKEINCLVDYYIPDRIEEGYGLNTDALNRIKERGSRLIITVDTGITAVKEADYAHQIGIDMIITDHHECQEDIPNAIAVVDPKRKDCNYPFDMLAGVGVAFKLIQGISQSINREDIVWKYIELAAIGTVADIVPLQSENRIIVQLAFKTICNTTNIGLKALMRVADIKTNKMTAGIIGFQIGPRLNAAGRLGDAKRGVELFITSDETIAIEIAENLNNENTRRQEMEIKILEEAIRIIETTIDINQAKVLVVAGHGWNHGVIGIVASRLVERYYLPTILLTIEDGIASGSARSVEGFSIFEALSNCKELFVKFGGHDMAAGMSLKQENIPVLAERLNQYANDVMTEETLIPKINVDFKLDIKEVSIELIERIRTLEPYGMGNEEPLFVIGGYIKTIKQIGQGNKHLKIDITNEEQVLPIIGFNHADFYNKLEYNNPIEVIGILSINEWQQNRIPQLIAKDIRLKPDFQNRILQYIESIPDLISFNIEDYIEIIPTRKDYENVFRYLIKLNSQQVNAIYINKMLPAIEGHTSEHLLKIIICLEVFKELDLMKYDIEDMKVVFAINRGKKVELQASKLYNKWTG